MSDDNEKPLLHAVRTVAAATLAAAVALDFRPGNADDLVRLTEEIRAKLFHDEGPRQQLLRRQMAHFAATRQ